jgi:hypothetical protein
MVSEKLNTLKTGRINSKNHANRKYNFSGCYKRDWRERKEFMLQISNCPRTFCSQKAKHPEQMKGFANM